MVGLVKTHGVSAALNEARRLRGRGDPVGAQRRLARAMRRFPASSHLRVMHADVMAEMGAAAPALVAYGAAREWIMGDARLRPQSRRYLLTYVAARRMRLAEELGLGQPWRALDRAVGLVPAPALYRRFFPAP